MVTMTVEATDWCPACERTLPLAAFKRERRKAACCTLNCWECSGACTDRRRRESMRAAHRHYRDLVFAHYGTVCRCCGSADRPTIDHVNGDGAEHRKTVTSLYRWLVRNDYPDGFQTLCRRCNASKQSAGHCRLDHSVPGQTRRRSQYELLLLRTPRK